MGHVWCVAYQTTRRTPTDLIQAATIRTLCNESKEAITLVDPMRRPPKSVLSNVKTETWWQAVDWSSLCKPARDPSAIPPSAYQGQAKQSDLFCATESIHESANTSDYNIPDWADDLISAERFLTHLEGAQDEHETRGDGGAGEEDWLGLMGPGNNVKDTHSMQWTLSCGGSSEHLQAA